MKVTITLTPNKDGSLTYSAETDEPTDNHPMLDQMRKDVLALHGSRETDVPALITAMQGDGSEIMLAISVNFAITDVGQLMKALDLKELPKKGLDRVIVGKEVSATVTVEDGIVVKAIRKLEEVHRK